MQFRRPASVARSFFRRAWKDQCPPRMDAAPVAPVGYVPASTSSQQAAPRPTGPTGRAGLRRMSRSEVAEARNGIRGALHEDARPGREHEGKQQAGRPEARRVPEAQHLCGCWGPRAVTRQGGAPERRTAPDVGRTVGLPGAPKAHTLTVHVLPPTRAVLRP